MNISKIAIITAVVFSFSLRRADAHDLVSLDTLHNPAIVMNLRYATEQNITQQKIYDSCTCCYVHKDVAHALKGAVQEFEHYGFGIVIWDAFQPKQELEKIWKLLPDENYITNPSHGDSHTRGMAVDVTLFDLKTGLEIDMPTSFDCITCKASCDACDISERACKNRDLLKIIMVKHGFVQNSQDPWWHFELAGWKVCPMLEITFEELV